MIRKEFVSGTRSCGKTYIQHLKIEKENEILKERIKKAIEFILIKDWDLEDIGVRYELIQILKGEKDEN